MSYQLTVNKLFDLIYYIDQMIRDRKAPMLNIWQY